MTADGAAETGRPAAFSVRLAATHGAQLFAASGFAIAQPLLDLLGTNAEFFAVRGSTRLDVVLFAFVVVAVPPAFLLLVELAAGAASERAAFVLHVLFLGALGTLFGVQALEQLGIVRTRLLVAGALAAGVAIAGAVVRVAAARTFLTILAPAPFVFLAFFFASSVSQILFPAAVEVRVASVESRTPVVMIVLDELPTVSLLDEQGAVDEGRFPSFARLAGTSTWFRSSTTLSGKTGRAVPALLTGKRPRAAVLPLFENHPDNVFTLLGGGHRLNVHARQMRLCPRELCSPPESTRFERLGALLSDARIVYLHLIAPPALESRLPAVDEAWADFGKAADGDRLRRDPGAFSAGRENDLARFVESLQADDSGAPFLDFLHVLLPHGPWVRFPDGRETATDHATAPGRTGERWWDESLALQAYQRHLLQTAYTDALLGELIDRLRALDRWDEALVVVTSDHGISFRGGDNRRAPTDTNLAELAFTPLFVKLPGQRRGTIEEKHVTSVDVLPTIADALGVEIPWEVDGVSGFAPGPGLPRVRVGPVRAPLAAALEQRDAALARKVALFGTGAFDDEFFGVGPYGGLVGEPLAHARVAGGAAGEARIDEHPRQLVAALSQGSLSVPTPLTGTLGDGAAAPGDPLAVAVNGVVAGVCDAYRESPEHDVRFSALVSPDAFRPGANEIRIFRIEGGSAAPLLRELAVG